MDCAMRKTVHYDVDFSKETKFKGRSVEDGLPVTKPIYDLEELFSWKAEDRLDPGQSFSVSSVPYYGKDITKGTTKTLVCHDMAGGYLGDRFVQGKLCTDDEWYYLAYWDIIDTFVYFSHHFVTIPPVGWINSAHRNGVAVMGTFITEGDGGFKRCDAIFSHDTVWKLIADQLVNIAKFYRFEGWLLNIENDIREENTENLRSFVRYLTDKMHDAIEGSQVIWYDSVTDVGVLEWQNQLNSRNKVYFDGCDGIFLNYGWDQVDLEKSAELAMVSQRVEDVYVGVDVFGRGCYGGGGMNTAVAVEFLRRYSLSAAIFAPGWVKEVLGAKDFEKNQAKFWTKLSPYCAQHAIILPHAYFSTRFHPGCETEGALRYLHLSQQSFFPHMSSRTLSSVPIDSLPHEVIITKCAKQILFKTKIPVMHFTPKQFDVYVTIKNHMKKSLCIDLKCGRELVSMTDVKSSNDGKWFLSGYCPVDEILCSTDDAEVELVEFILVSNPIVTDTFSQNWVLNIAESKGKGIDLSLDDVTWKKPEDSNKILMSCTLLLEGTDISLPAMVYFGTSESEVAPLGVVYCTRFRIHDLSVPDPNRHGPDAKIFLLVEQKNPIPMICDGAGYLKSRRGELEITYGERMCSPFCAALPVDATADALK